MGRYFSDFRECSPLEVLWRGLSPSRLHTTRRTGGAVRTGEGRAWGCRVERARVRGRKELDPGWRESCPMANRGMFHVKRREAGDTRAGRREVEERPHLNEVEATGVRYTRGADLDPRSGTYVGSV